MINFKQLKSSILKPTDKLKDALRCLEKVKLELFLFVKKRI